MSKETAVQDLVNDYKRGAERLLGKYQEAREEELNTHHKSSKKSKRDLAALYNGAEENLERERDKVKRRPVAEYEQTWQERREVQKTRLEAALGALEALEV